MLFLHWMSGPLCPFFISCVLPPCPAELAQVCRTILSLLWEKATKWALFETIQLTLLTTLHKFQMFTMQLAGTKKGWFTNVRL